MAFGSDDTSVMASLAARLLGKTSASVAPKPTTSAAPRSTTTTQSAPVQSDKALPKSTTNTQTQNLTSNAAKKNAVPKSTTDTVAQKSTSSTTTAKENTPPNPPISNTFVKEDHPVISQEINSGPSLLGNADQLAEARKFASSATQGVPRSRPTSRASRTRLASKEPERPPSANLSISARSRLTPAAPNSGGQAFGASQSLGTGQSTGFVRPSGNGDMFSTTVSGPPTAQSSTMGPAVRLPAEGSSSGNKPRFTLTAAVAPTPAPTPVGSPSQSITSGLKERVNGVSNVKAMKTKDEFVDSVTKDLKKMELSHAHPPSPALPKKEEAKSLHARQLADITSTFKQQAAGATTPPHLRSRVVAAGIPEKRASKPEKEVTAKDETDNSDSKKDDGSKVNGLMLGALNKATSADEAPPTNRLEIDELDWLKTETKTNSVQKNHSPTVATSKDASTNSKKEPALDAINGDNPFVKSSKAPSPEMKFEPVTDTSKQAATGNSAKENDKHGNDSKDDRKEILRLLKQLQSTVEAVSTRVEKLEMENFDMQKQLVSLNEEQERRKFLGTNSAKAPFPLEVKLPNGTTHMVQVHAELKVYEFVRRIRAKAALAPMASTNPRVKIDGRFIGHAMYLGEVGVFDGTRSKVELTYDEA